MVIKKAQSKISLINIKGQIKIRYKDTKGKTHIHKYDGKTPIDHIIEYHENRNKYKKISEAKKKYITIKKEPTTKIRKLLKKTENKTIDQTLKRGITTTKIIDIRQVGKEQLQKAYTELLKPLVKSKALLKILATEDNMRKIAYRIEQTYEYNGKPELSRGTYEQLEEKLGESKIIGKETPMITIEKLKQAIQNNTLIYHASDGSGSTLIQKVKSNGHQYHHNQNGQVDRIGATITLRY